MSALENSPYKLTRKKNEQLSIDDLEAISDALHCDIQVFKDKYSEPTYYFSKEPIYNYPLVLYLEKGSEGILYEDIIVSEINSVRSEKLNEYIHSINGTNVINTKKILIKIRKFRKLKKDKEKLLKVVYDLLNSSAILIKVLKSFSERIKFSEEILEKQINQLEKSAKIMKKGINVEKSKSSIGEISDYLLDSLKNFDVVNVCKCLDTINGYHSLSSFNQSMSAHSNTSNISNKESIASSPTSIILSYYLEEIDKDKSRKKGELIDKDKSIEEDKSSKKNESTNSTESSICYRCSKTHSDYIKLECSHILCINCAKE